MKQMMLVFPMIALLASCGQKQEGQGASDARDAQSEKHFDVSSEDSASGPNIGVSAAPGVAFNYRYAFRLPNAKISSVQEAHAQMCEKLGINRCRITGMRYRLVDDDDVQAMLAFKLDPSLARQFGKDGIANVNNAEGMLVDSEITGVDAGAAISAADKNIAQLQDDLNRIDARLALKLSNDERVRLTEEAQSLRQQMRATRDNRADNKESLATTPMVFEYGSGSVIPGFDGGSPLRDAMRTAVGAFMTMLSFLIIAVGVLLPWGVLIGSIFWLIRRFRPDMFGVNRKNSTDNPAVPS
ncbi:MAG: hypothetical protein ABL918_05110 [Chakrabartia sp.]